MSGWAGTADAYAVSFARLCAGPVPELLAALGPADHRRSLLDVGCGPGTVASAARRAGYAVIGSDADASMLGLARRQHPALVLVGGALPDLPFVGGRFDAVAANFVVNHTPDPRAAVRELARVTRPGGRLALTVWAAAPAPLNQLWGDVLAAASVAPPPAKTLPPELDFDRTPTGLAGLLVGAGLTDVVVRPAEWLFRIGTEDLWRAVAGGVATIGRAYQGQPPAGRQRVRAAYLRLTAERHPSGELRFPSSALLASASRRTG